MCIAGRASLSVRAHTEAGGRGGIIEQCGKPHHFIFIDGQLVKAMVPSDQSTVNTAENTELDTQVNIKCSMIMY